MIYYQQHLYINNRYVKVSHWAFEEPNVT